LILSGANGHPTAMAAVIDSSYVVATLDVASLKDVRVQQYAYDGDTAVVVGEPIDATLLSPHSATRLCVFKLRGTLSNAAALAQNDPAVRWTVRKRSFFTPPEAGPIVETLSDVRLETPEGSVVFDNGLVVRIPSRPGDSGAPLVDADGQLVAITVGGSATQ